MCKKILVYLIVFYISIFPVQRANSVIPVVAGAAWAIDLAAPVAIRYLASEIAISSIVKAVQVSNAYYSATSKISNANFLKFFKSKAALGTAAFTGIVAAVGYSLTNDGIFMTSGSVDVPDGDVAPQAGIGWCEASRCGSSITEVATSVCSGYQYCRDFTITAYRHDPARDDLRTVTYHISDTNDWRVADVQSKPCQYINSGQSVATCDDGWTPPTGESVPVSDELATTSIVEHIESLPAEDQSLLIADSEGVLDESLIDDLTADDAPPMPSGDSGIPNIGDQSWTNAHLITTGVAQSSDSSAPNYVSTSDWDEAYYLGNTVANGNDYVTGLNSGAIANPDAGTGTDTGTDAGLIVDVSGVETRLDTTNQLSQRILDEVVQVNSTNVSLQSVPNDSVAASFWPVRYPDGLAGVLNNFIEDMKQTPIFEWLDEFVLNLVSGSLPAFDLCFDVIAGIDFGCYTLKADAYIWSAIKACMILFSVIVSRRIVFGG
ncbi:hypothetical protein AB6D16_018990 [Vibrio cyclitrophicus]